MKPPRMSRAEELALYLAMNDIREALDAGDDAVAFARRRAEQNGIDVVLAAILAKQAHDACRHVQTEKGADHGEGTAGIRTRRIASRGRVC